MAKSTLTRDRGYKNQKAALPNIPTGLLLIASVFERGYQRIALVVGGSPLGKLAVDLVEYLL